MQHSKIAFKKVSPDISMAGLHNSISKLQDVFTDLRFVREIQVSQINHGHIVVNVSLAQDHRGHRHVLLEYLKVKLPNENLQIKIRQAGSY